MRTIILLRLAFAFFVLAPLDVRASELWGREGLTALCATLRPADDRVVQAMFKEYLPVIAQQGIDLRQARIAEAKDVLPLLAQAVRLGWGPMEFFTDREFAHQGACLLLLNQQTLSEIDEKYDVHGLWMISAPVEGQKNVAMEFLLLGQGKLVVGYPRKETVKVKDYDLWTGRYTYEPFMSVDIINDGQSRKLNNIKTLDSPDGEWLPFHGPLDADILSFELENEFIRVTYFKLDEMTERIHKIGISSR